MPILLVLYCLIRVPILLSYSDLLHLELHRGNIAIEFIEGLRLPLGDYIVDPYSLSPLFNGLLTIPSFLIFGKTLFALKLVPFLWHLVSLIIWFYVWRSFFSARGAFFILLLFVLAPPRIVEYSLSNHGTHFEAILWTGFSLLLFKKTIDGKIGMAWGGFGLGLLGGFASSLHPIHIIFAFVLLFYSLWVNKNKMLYVGYGLGFLIGFFPWLYFNSHHQWAGLDWPKELFFYPMELKTILQNLWRVFLAAQKESGLKSLLGFHNFPSPFRQITTYLYEGIYLFSLLTLFFQRGLWRNLKICLDIKVIAVIYQMLLISLVVISQFGFEYYLFPMGPFIGMTMVVAVQEVRPILRRGVLGFCFLTGLWGNLLLIDVKGFGKTLQMEGFSHPQLLEVMEERFGHDPDLFQKKIRLLERGSKK